MSTDSRTWFYTTPEPRAFLIEERVNHTLWRNRLANIWLTCVQTEPPFRMVGRWADAMPIEFEWQPGQWFVLRLGEENKELIGVMRQILFFRPSFMYQDSEGMTCVEWHTDGGLERWKSLQGNAAFQNLRLLNKSIKAAS